ncbi:MAG: protein tyrosine phosphatase, partial [Polyangiaceae bacterium]|nr:protein tyrosine phosphatase [Polyangiaceae bacterium]
MTGYVDLHCHYLPGIDDGVRSLEEGVELCRRLRAAGFEKVIATPHMRTALYENDAASIDAKFEEFRTHAHEIEGMPELGVGSEHFLDDVVFARFRNRNVVTYPGG